MEKDTMKKMSGTLFNVILYVFLAVCVLSVFLTVFSKKDDGATEVGGYQLRIVASDSMAACELTDVSAFEIKDIPVRTMVFVEVMPDDPAKADEWYRALKVGDVLTFRYVYSTQVTITHRITSITEQETGGFLIELAGDNKMSEDGQLKQVIDTSLPYNTNYVIGKVTGTSYLFGVVMSFLMKPISIVLIVILPCFAIIMLEVIKIMRMLSMDKRKKEIAKREEIEGELEELRTRLAELQAQNEAPASEDTGQKEDEQT